MKANFPLPLAAMAAASALLSSCYYEPYAYGPSTSVSGSVGYSSNGHVSSSVFIRTTNSRWGYDPYCHSYYDYTTRCYYDPWLRGYYPRGYRPPVIVGAPHPHGWRPGKKYCPPPSHVRNHRLKDYGNRHAHYRKLNHSWAKHVRSNPVANRDHWGRGHSSSSRVPQAATRHSSDRGSAYRSGNDHYRRGYQSGAASPRSWQSHDRERNDSGRTFSRPGSTRPSSGFSGSSRGNHDAGRGRAGSSSRSRASRGDSGSRDTHASGGSGHGGGFRHQDSQRTTDRSRQHGGRSSRDSADRSSGKSKKDFHVTDHFGFRRSKD